MNIFVEKSRHVGEKVTELEMWSQDRLHFLTDPPLDFVRNTAMNNKGIRPDMTAVYNVPTRRIMAQHRQPTVLAVDAAVHSI